MWEPINHPAPPCPECGLALVRAWLTKCSAVIGDEMHHWQVNGLKTPRLFESKQERRRWMKEEGFRECAYHIGLDGSDKSKHTRRWEAMDAQTLENARILVERAAQEPTRNEPKETPLKARLTMGELNSPEFAAWRNGR